MGFNYSLIAMLVITYAVAIYTIFTSDYQIGYDIFLIKNLILLVFLSTVGLAMLYNMKYKYNYEYKKQRNAIILFLVAENSSLVVYILAHILPQND